MAGKYGTDRNRNGLTGKADRMIGALKDKSGIARNVNGSKIVDHLGLSRPNAMRQGSYANASGYPAISGMPRAQVKLQGPKAASMPKSSRIPKVGK